MKVDLLAYTPEPEKVIAMAAKLCYSPVGVSELKEDLTEEKVQKFVKHLMSLGHESPIEHVSFTFGIEGISRSCSHQFVRHRHASYSQQSQRYVKLDQFEYIIPPAIAEDGDTRKLFIKHMEDSQWCYDKLVDKLIENKVTDKYPDWISEVSEEFWKLGKEEFLALDKDILNLWKKYHIKEYNAIEKEAIEDARYVFPNACETKMVVTMNLRALLNFCHHRCCNRAQWEIREVAWEIVKRIEEVSPLLASCLGASCQFSKCPEGAMCCGDPYESKVK